MLSRIPFFRLSLFLSIGIIAQWQRQIPAALVWALIGASAVCFAIPFILKREQQYRFRFLFGTGLACLLAVGGVLMTKAVQKQSEWNIPMENYQYQAIILDEPVAKPKTRMCKIRILSAEGAIHAAVAGKKAVIYLPKDSLSNSLVAGDCLLFYGQLSPPPTYLKKQSVAASGFIRNNQWVRDSNASPPFSIRLKALAGRRMMLQRLQQIIPESNACAIAGALMFGYQNEIDDALLQSVRNIGAAHILAISGTHFAILFGMLYYLLTLLLGNYPNRRWIKQVSLLPLAWVFAFLTGFSPSVFRSVLMLTIWGVGELLDRRAFTLNTVAVTAFIMLLINPLYLFDAGCQLSFLAVIAILLLSPYLIGLYESKNPALRYLWEMISVSIAAQAGVLPLTTYYFHQFPVAFLLTNICLLPLSTVLLILIPVSLMIQAVVGSVRWLMYPLNWALDGFISTIQYLDRLSRYNIDNVYIDRVDTFLLFVLVLVVSGLFIKKRVVYFYLLLLVIAFQVMYHVR
jgi:competence protein ComEC